MSAAAPETVREMRVLVSPDEYQALLDMYHGMLAAASNGTGYSPLVAEAMKRLKELYGN